MTENINKKVEALTFWQQQILCKPVKGGITNLIFGWSMVAEIHSTLDFDY